MGNRIIFEASINTTPFRRSIGEMTSITNAFFDAADARVDEFSRRLGSVGSNFNTSSNLEAASESASARGSYNSNTSDTLDLAVDGLAMAASTFLGKPGAVAGMTTWAVHRSGLVQFTREELIGDNAIDTLGRDLQLITSLFQPIIDIMARLDEVSMDALRNELNETRVEMDPLIERSREVTEAIEEMGGVFVESMGEGTFHVIDERWTEFFDLIYEGAEQTAKAVTESYEGMVDTLIDAITEMDHSWEEHCRFFEEMTEEANKNVVESFKTMVDEFLTNALEPMDDRWGIFYEDLKEGAQTASNAVKTFFNSMSQNIAEGSIDKTREDFVTLWKGVREGGETVGEAMLNLFRSLPDGIRNPINGIISMVNGMVHRIITGLNSAIDGINTMGFDLPAFLGGGSFRPNIPKIPPVQIPMLARGGIVDRPTLALIGERGKEAVMPLENNTGWITDLANSIGVVVGAQLVMNRAQDYNMMDDHQRPIKLYLDGRMVAEGIMNDFIEVARQRDVQLVPVF